MKYTSHKDNSDLKEPRSNAINGAFFMFLAVGSFTILDTTLKYLSSQYPVILLIWIRYFLQAIYMTALLPTLGRIDQFKTKQWHVQILRGLLLTCGSVLIVLSLQHLPMAQTYAVTFSTPLIATAIAVPLLRERTNAFQWMAILAGLGGVLVALSPSPDMLHPSLLLPLLMALANAGYQVTTRLGARQDSTLTLTLYAAVSCTFWAALFLPFVFVPIRSGDLLILLAAGLLGTSAQLLLAKAVRTAPMAVVSPMGYSQIIWAIAIGYFVFDQVPSLPTLMGAAIVAASGIALVRLHPTANQFVS